jgi:hypothetical protein
MNVIVLIEIRYLFLKLISYKDSDFSSCCFEAVSFYSSIHLSYLKF